MNLWAKMLLNQKKKDPSVITQLAAARVTLHSAANEFKNIKISCATTQTSVGYLYIYLTDTSIYKPYCYGTDGETLLGLSGSPGGVRYAIQLQPKNFETGVMYTLNGGVILIDNPDYENPVQTFTISYIKTNDTNPFGG